MDNYSSCMDRAFLPRGLALVRSLTRHARPFRMWVLCFDDATYDILARLRCEEIVPVNENDIFDADLRHMKQHRSRREYYFGCKPWIALHILDADRSITRITHLDSDLYYFSDPRQLQPEIDLASIALTPHRSGHAKYEERFGLFNAGWTSFARDEVGLSALRWWRERCIEGSPDYPTNGRFADQKYLEEMARRNDGVIALSHKGANLAPWNVDRSSLQMVGERVTVDGDPLIFFHFHGVERRGPRLFDPGLPIRRRARILRDAVYRPYLAELEECERIADSISPRARPAKIAGWGASRPRPWWWRTSRKVIQVSSGILSARLIFVRPRSPSNRLDHAPSASLDRSAPDRT